MVLSQLFTSLDSLHVQRNKTVVTLRQCLEESLLNTLVANEFSIYEFYKSFIFERFPALLTSSPSTICDSAVLPSFENPGSRSTSVLLDSKYNVVTHFKLTTISANPLFGFNIQLVCLGVTFGYSKVLYFTQLAAAHVHDDDADMATTVFLPVNKHGAKVLKIRRAPPILENIFWKCLKISNQQFWIETSVKVRK